MALKMSSFNNKCLTVLFTQNINAQEHFETDSHKNTGDTFCKNGNLKKCYSVCKNPKIIIVCLQQQGKGSGSEELWNVVGE